MYTLNKTSLSRIRVFNKMWLSENIAPSAIAETNETKEDNNIIVNSFRDLFRHTKFVTQVQEKISTLPQWEQSRLNIALTNVLKINADIETIHANVRWQLATLLNTVENPTA